MKVPVDKHARMATMRKVTHARQHAEQRAQARENAQLRDYASMILTDANRRVAQREQEVIDQQRKAARTAAARKSVETRRANAAQYAAEHAARVARYAAQQAQREQQAAARAHAEAQAIEQARIAAREREQQLLGRAVYGWQV